MKKQSLFLLAILSLLTLFVVSCGEENPLNPDEINQRGTISGTIVDQFEKPLSGVSVTTNKEGFNSNSILDGSYSIPDIESDQYMLTFSKVGFFDTTMDTTIAIAKMAQVININMVMRKKTGTISGSVTDTAGAALTNVTVTLSPTVDGVGSEKSINTGTDAAFSIEKVDLGIYEVQCTHPSYTATNFPLCTLSSDDYTDSVSVTMRYNGGGDVGTITGTLQSGPGEVATLTNWGVSVLGTSVGVSGNTDSESVAFTISNVPAGTYSVECTDLKHKADTVKNITVAVGKATDMGTITLVDDGTKWMNRSVLGQFSVHRDTVDTVILEVQGEGIPNWTPFECSYNKTYGTLSGVVLVPETGQAWDVRAKAFIKRNDSLIKIGQCNKVEFTKSSGDVELTEFIDPTNAIPTISIDSVKQKNKINTKISFTATVDDPFDNKIKDIHWNIDTIPKLDIDTLIHTFSEGNKEYSVIATVYDDDGNHANDTLKIHITDLEPRIVINSKPSTVPKSERTTIEFDVIDDGVTYSCEYKLEGGTFQTCDTHSLQFTAPDTLDGHYEVTIKTTDDDGRSSEVTCTLSVGCFFNNYSGFDESGYYVEWGKSIVESNNHYFIAGNIDGVNFQVSKFDQVGKLLKQTTVINDSCEIACKLKQTNDNNLILSGQCYAPVDRGILMKLDKACQILFTKKLSQITNIQDIIEVADGFVMTGNSSNNKFSILKTDLSGNVIWNYDNEDSIVATGNSIIQTENNNFISVGQSGDYTTKKNIKIHKIDHSGIKLWSKTIERNESTVAKKILRLPSNEFLIIGNYFNTTFSNGFLVKIDAKGNIIDETVLNTPSLTIEDAINCKDFSSYLITGTFGKNNNIGILKINESGNIIWIKSSYGGDELDTGSSIATSSDNGIIITGRTISFGTGNNNMINNIQDYFLLKTDSNGDIVAFE